MPWARLMRGRMQPRESRRWLPIVVAGWIAAAGVAAADAETRLTFPYSDVAYASIGDYRALARAAAPSYVQVTIRVPARTGMGRDSGPRNRVVGGASGIVVPPEGYVVTAAHIARSPRFEAEIHTLDGHTYAARIVHVQADRDLALLRVTEPGFQYPTARAAEAVHANQAVMAIGTPDNRPGVVTVGRVRRPRVHKRIRYGDFGFADAVELTMRVAPGHSGGPVLNADGRLVGMLVGFDLRETASGNHVSTGAAYAIPAAEVLEYANRWADPTETF